MQLGLHSSFFDELLFNTLDSIDWQSFKVADLLKKEWQQGKQNQKKMSTVSKIHSIVMTRHSLVFGLQFGFIRSSNTGYYWKDNSFVSFLKKMSVVGGSDLIQKVCAV